MEPRPGQTFIGFKVSEELAAAIAKASNGRDTSQFVREAVSEKLIAMGLKVKEESILPPSRKGKGGPTKYKITQSQSQSQKKKI